MGQWIITRPEPDATALVNQLRAMGQDAVSSPALIVRSRITADTINCSDRATPDGIVFTSRNGVRFGACLVPNRTVPVYAVGAATAADASAAGFSAITCGTGDASALAEVIGRSARNRPASASPMRLLHPCGVHQAGSLDVQFAGMGVRLDQVAVYEALPADSLSNEAYAALATGTATGILFFSPRTAESVARLITASGMDDCLKRVYAVCLSDNVAGRVRHFPWRRILVAQAPTTRAILGLVTNLPS